MNVLILQQTSVTPTPFAQTLKDLTSVDVSKDMREMALTVQVKQAKRIVCVNG